MPLDRFVLILALVLIAGGATVWIATALAAAAGHPLVGAAVLVPVLLAAYVIWRVIADRLSNREDDHYDNIDR